MTIREIAAKTNMSTDTLRYYERIGLLPPVPRNAAGIRNYDEYFVNFINFIKKLKASGMSLEHIIDYIRLAEMGDALRYRSVKSCWQRLVKRCLIKSTVCSWLRNWQIIS